MNRYTIIVVSVVALFIIEGVTVAAVLTSQDARDGLGGFAQDVSDLWAGTEETPGLFARFGDRAEETITSWILPVWESPQTQPADPTEFSRCTDCHEEYWRRVRSSDLYFNHPLHAQEGITCGTCHTDTSHPEPLAPPERVCAECHTEVGAESECRYCHVPGSLPHYYDFAMPRGGYVDCGACHLPDSFVAGSDHHLITIGSFDGTVPGECTSCHTTQKCQSCHSVDHPGNWAQDHGEQVDFGGANNCGTCHTEAFCSDACHAGIRPGSRQLPIGGNTG